MLLEKVCIALLMMFLSSIIHALFMIGGSHALDWRLARFGYPRGHFDKAVLVWVLTICMFFAIVIEVWVWVLAYLYSPELTDLPDPHTAFYFSMVTFTTPGYGDVVLSGGWRTLASIQAANGVIIFGWTTALIFYLIQKPYKDE